MQRLNECSDSVGVLSPFDFVVGQPEAGDGLAAGEGGHFAEHRFMLGAPVR
jgi:hypothetical protein